ncbi:hypothetical protein LguiB_031632 [Lonicera macranthoides]
MKNPSEISRKGKNMKCGKSGQYGRNKKTYKAKLSKKDPKKREQKMRDSSKR